MEHPDEEINIVDRAYPFRYGRLNCARKGVPGSVTSERWDSDREDIVKRLIRWNPECGWDEAKRDVEAMLTSNWHLVVSLAEALLSRKTLTGKEAKAILDEDK